MKNGDINTILNTIILNARPGAGKSEIIKFLRYLVPEIRKAEYHVGKIKVIDDFPYLWRWFEEDFLLEEMGKEHLFTDSEGYFLHLHQWDLLIKMIDLEYEKFLRDCAHPEEYTVFIEFSRGTQHGGYKRAYPFLSDQILQQAGLLYVNVSWEESLRKNRKRFNPDKPDSILEHGIPDKKLEFMYSACDFDELADKKEGTITINDHKIPLAIFENEDDVTTNYGSELSKRLKNCLQSLWERL